MTAERIWNLTYENKSTLDNIERLEEPRQTVDYIVSRPSSPESRYSRFKRLFRESMECAWSYLFSLTFILFTTFIVFPGIIFDFEIRFIGRIVKDPIMILPWTFWTIVMLFNIFDTLGKLLIETRLGNIGNSLAYVLSFSRVLLVVICFLIKYKVYSSDWFNILTIILFALSNGFCLSTMAIKAT